MSATPVLIIVALIELVGTIYAAQQASKARSHAGDAKDASEGAAKGAEVNRRTLERIEVTANEVQENGEAIRRILDDNRSTLLAVHGFEEYQHTRNHDIMNGVTAVNMKIDILLRDTNIKQDRMIELLERIADK